MTVETKLDRSTIHRTELAKAVGADLAHISKIMSGRRTPSLHLAKKIAMHLNVSMDELYDFLYPDGRIPVQDARKLENQKTKTHKQPELE